jgi:hypothetical protein
LQENLISGAPPTFLVPRPAADLFDENLMSGAPLFVVGPEKEEEL